MYSVQKMILHNICQYYDYEIDIGEGMHAITGRNGIGKSNLCRALAYALTGIVDGSWGSQSELQKNGTADPGHVTVILQDTASSVQYRIRRYVTKTVTSGTACADYIDRITQDGEERVATRRKQVNQYLEDMYGISCPLLFQLCWVRQGHLDELLLSPASFVNTFMQTVFAMQRFERIKDVAKTVYSNIATYPDYTMELATAKAELDSIEEPDELNVRLRKLTDERHAKEQELGQLEAARSGGISEKRLEDMRSIVINALTDARRQLEELTEVEDPGIDPDTVKDASTLYATAQFQRKELILKAENVAELMKLNRTEWEALRAQWNELRTNVKAKLSQLDDIPDRCHLCGGVIEQRDAYEKARCMLITGFNSRDEYIKVQSEISDKYVKDMNNILGILSDRQAELADYDAQTDKLNQEIQDLELRKQQEQELIRYQKYIDQRDQLKSVIDRSEQFIQDYAHVITYPDDIDNKINNVTIAARNIEENIKDINDRINMVEGRKNAVKARIEHIQEQIKKSALNTQVRDFFASVRGVMDRAQLIYLKNRIQQINTLLQSYMQGTDMPFSAYLSEASHTFEYTTSDGYTHPAAHLSGAQKAMTAVALQMAVLSVVAPSINICMLDEPGEALDEQNKFLLSDMLGRLARLLPSVQGTLMIVTRDRQILDNCTKVTEVTDDSCNSC